MDKSYEILSQDKVFENNIILGYDHHNYEEPLDAEPDGGPVKCTRPNASSDPIDFARPCVVSTARNINEKSSGSTRKDVMLGSLNVDDYNTDYVVSTATDINNKPRMKSFIQSSSNITKLDASVHLCTNVDRASKSSVGGEEQIGPERGNVINCCSTNVLADVMRESEGHCVTNLEPDAERRTEASERSENCFTNERGISCINTRQTNQGNDKELPFKMKFIEKDSSITINDNGQEERPCIEDDQPEAILHTNDVTVGSNLQFLNTGESIVVLTQDVNNIGLPSSMVSPNEGKHFYFESWALGNSSIIQDHS